MVVVVMAVQVMAEVMAVMGAVVVMEKVMTDV